MYLTHFSRPASFCKFIFEHQTWRNCKCCQNCAQRRILPGCCRVLQKRQKTVHWMKSVQPQPTIQSFCVWAQLFPKQHETTTANNKSNLQAISPQIYIGQLARCSDNHLLINCAIPWGSCKACSFETADSVSICDCQAQNLPVVLLHYLALNVLCVWKQESANCFLTWMNSSLLRCCLQCQTWGFLFCVCIFYLLRTKRHL